VSTFAGEIPRVPGAAIKNTYLTVYIVLLGFSYWVFKSIWTFTNLVFDAKITRLVCLAILSNLSIFLLWSEGS